MPVGSETDQEQCHKVPLAHHLLGGDSTIDREAIINRCSGFLLTTIHEKRNKITLFSHYDVAAVQNSQPRPSSSPQSLGYIKSSA